jgi:hypothetical protein
MGSQSSKPDSVKNTKHCCKKCKKCKTVYNTDTQKHCCECKIVYNTDTQKHCCECKIVYSSKYDIFFKTHCCACKTVYSIHGNHCCECKIAYSINTENHCCKCNIKYDKIQCTREYNTHKFSYQYYERDYHLCDINCNTNHCCKCKTVERDYHLCDINCNTNHCCKCKTVYNNSQKHCCKCKMAYNNSQKHCCECKIVYMNNKKHCCECKMAYDNYYEKHCCKCKMVYMYNEKHCCECKIIYMNNETPCCLECKMEWSFTLPNIKLIEIIGNKILYNEWLDTNDGLHWLYTNDGITWLNCINGWNYISNKQHLINLDLFNIAISKSQYKILLEKDKINWFKSDFGVCFLQSENGKIFIEWMKAWVNQPEYLKWLFTSDGNAWAINNMNEYILSVITSSQLEVKIVNGIVLNTD